MKPKPENDPRHLLDQVNAAQRQLHTNVNALRLNLAQLSQHVTQRVHTAYAPENSFRPSVMRAGMTSIVHGNLALEFAITDSLVRMLENSPEFKAADAIIEPLLLAAAQLEVWEQKEREDAAGAAAALRDAREAAQKRAIEKSENDPEVVAAKRKLETAVSAK